MKKTAYVIFFFVLSICFVMVYYAGYYFATQKINDQDIVKISDTKESDSSTEDDIKSVDLNSNDILSKDTKYTLESYDIQSDTVNEKNMEIPAEMIGLNREEVIEYISKNSDSFGEENEEIANVQLVSFSSSSIVLRKSYMPAQGEDTSDYKYWLKDLDGNIVVYKADKTTVYFNTDISTSLLPEEEKKQIEEGKFIKNIHELYNYLESYSS